MPGRLAFLPATVERLRGGQPPVIVTGAGGWLGMAALEMLETALGDRIHTQVRAFTTRARDLTLRSGRRISAMPFETLAQTQMAPSLILHFAFLTRGHAAAMKLADYVEANRAITHSLVALMERDGALGLFMPSSGAVYGAHGGLDEDLSGNPYGVLKRQDEERFMTLGENLVCPVAVIRIFNLAGPYINNPNGYALASILTEIGQGGPIRLRARQPVWRSYTHVADMLNVGLAILLAKAATPPFDTAGDEVIEIADLARRAATLCGAPSIPILRPELDLQISDRYAGDGGLYRALAADFGLTLQQLDANIVDTYSYITGQVRHPRSLRVQ